MYNRNKNSTEGYVAPKQTQNSRVHARVVENVDKRTNGQMNGKPDPYITPCQKQAQQKGVKNIQPYSRSICNLEHKCKLDL